MNFGTTVLRLGIAFLLGGIIGYERELEHKPAGLRTHILVCVGAAMFVVISESLSLASIPLDQSRVIAGVAQGVGFLGAGTIFVAKRTVHGLTTAAGVWAASAVGVACGFGLWWVAIIGAALTIFTLQGLSPLSKVIEDN